MITAEKNLFLQKLANDTDTQLVSTLHFFRSNGDTSLLPNVLELLASDRSDEIKDEILTLVSDIKTQDAAFVAFDFMVNTQNMEIKKLMLNALWQSGADFSEKAEDIVNLMLCFNEFEPAFDTFTLLENCAENIAKDTAKALADKVEAAEKLASPELSGIYVSMKNHLRDIENGIVKADELGQI